MNENAGEGDPRGREAFAHMDGVTQGQAAGSECNLPRELNLPAIATLTSYLAIG